MLYYFRYKEEVLKRLYKELANSMQDQFRDWIRAKQENTSTDCKSPCPPPARQAQASIASTSSSSSSHSSHSSDSKQFLYLCAMCHFRL